jgi:hypothetical protein
MFLDQQTQHHAKNHPADARRRAVADLCHMLLSANEFAYGLRASKMSVEVRRLS